MTALVRLSIAMGIMVALGAGPLFAQAPQLKIRGSQPAHCAEIEALGPSFAPLAKVCQFVDSPTVLPSFVCTEKTQAFRHKLGSKYQYAFDTFTAEVTFDNGAQSYANIAINGRPKSDYRSERSLTG